MDQILAEEAVDGGTADLVGWTLTDHLNTVRDIARFDPQTGATTVVNHLLYDAFGRVTAESNPAVDSLFLFTARPFDPDTGLQNNLNRWYDARVGRWLSEDPLGYRAEDSNVYRYLLNSPTNALDPEGEKPIMVTFGAFIGGWRGAWLPQPRSPWGWWYKTDQRGFGGGTYRLAGRILFDTKDIGKITRANSNGYVFTTSSTRRRWNGTAWVYETAKSIPTGSVGFKNLSACHTVWQISASAGYPFISLTNVINPIDFGVQVHAVSLGGCSIIWATGWHDAFPDYEGRVSGGFPTQIYSYASPAAGPGIGPATLGPGGNVVFTSLPSIECSVPSWLSRVWALIATFAFPGF